MWAVCNLFTSLHCITTCFKPTLTFTATKDVQVPRMGPGCDVGEFCPLQGVTASGFSSGRTERVPVITVFVANNVEGGLTIFFVVLGAHSCLFLSDFATTRHTYSCHECKLLLLA
jgi:hypothetical protein